MKNNIFKLPIFILSIIIGLTYTYSTSKSNDNLSTIQEGIAGKIVRFHVIANSDSDEDQAIKLEVKKAIVSYTSDILSSSQSIEETRQLLLDNTDNIINIAKDVVSENGYDYAVTAELTDAYFPTKSYGNYTFPPGTYQAYQIKIGEAKGQNWWCVLYPPLCFIDISHGIVGAESEDMLRETLTTDEFDAISGEYKVKFKFRYLKFLNR
jgi:stage II sporulation protein R